MGPALEAAPRRAREGQGPVRAAGPPAGTRVDWPALVETVDTWWRAPFARARGRPFETETNPGGRRQLLFPMGRCNCRSVPRMLHNAGARDSATRGGSPGAACACRVRAQGEDAIARAIRSWAGESVVGRTAISLISWCSVRHASGGHLCVSRVLRFTISAFARTVRRFL